MPFSFLEDHADEIIVVVLCLVGFVVGQFCEHLDYVVEAAQTNHEVEIVFDCIPLFACFCFGSFE